MTTIDAPIVCRLEKSNSPPGVSGALLFEPIALLADRKWLSKWPREHTNMVSGSQNSPMNTSWESLTPMVSMTSPQSFKLNHTAGLSMSQRADLSWILPTSHRFPQSLVCKAWPRTKPSPWPSSSAVCRQGCQSMPGILYPILTSTSPTFVAALQRTCFALVPTESHSLRYRLFSLPNNCIIIDVASLDMFSGSSRSFFTSLVSPRKISRDGYGSANIIPQACTSHLGTSHPASRKRPSISPRDYGQRPVTRPSFGPLSSTSVRARRSFSPSTTCSSGTVCGSRNLQLATINVM